MVCVWVGWVGWGGGERGTAGWLTHAGRHQCMPPVGCASGIQANLPSLGSPLHYRVPRCC